MNYWEMDGKMKKQTLDYLFIPIVAIISLLTTYFESSISNMSFYNSILLNILNLFLCYGIVSIIIFFKDKEVNYFLQGFSLLKLVKILLIAIFSMLVCYFFQNAIFNFLFAVYGYVPQMYLPLIDNILFEENNYTIFQQISLIICFGIITPILEEFFFRKILQEHFKKVSYILRIIFTTFCFVITHDDLDLMIFVLPMSIFCSLVMHTTGHLLYPIIIHCIINIVGILEIPINEMLFSPRYAIQYNEISVAFSNIIFNLAIVAFFSIIIYMIIPNKNQRNIKEETHILTIDNILFIAASLSYIILTV